MYLKDVLVKNIGPISHIDLTLPFDEGGLPKPIILVGRNGSGKSILLAHVVDAVVEMAKTQFRDIVQGQNFMAAPFFKISGGTNQKLGEGFGLALLEFDHKAELFSYVDKSGELDSSSYESILKGRFQGVKTWDENKTEKKVSMERSTYESVFEDNVFCYFPLGRRELPHWFNRNSMSETASYASETRVQGILGKPMIIESSSRENRNWLLDVFLDSLVDLDHRDGEYHFGGSDQKLRTKMFLRSGRTNIEMILKEILRNDVKLEVNFRNSGAGRLCITKENEVIIPSLDHLSSGQAVLFNLFATIVRYADRNDLSKSVHLNDIEGIVLVDEIDSHVHSDLQFEVLPSLIRLFPKVQFILTSHAPLFLLGMEKEFGSNGIQIVNMPEGITITTERFAEFGKSFDYYKKTKAFEEEINDALIENDKPMILTEGETDPKYIIAALELLGFQDLLEKVTVNWIGLQRAKGPMHTGDTALTQTKNHYVANPDLLKRKLLLLYDCDTGKPNEQHGNLYVKAIEPNAVNTRISKGIENLLPKELFEDRFYSTRELQGDYGESNRITKFDKAGFCKWICEERREPADFMGFRELAAFIEEFVNPN